MNKVIVLAASLVFIAATSWADWSLRPFPGSGVFFTPIVQCNEGDFVIFKSPQGGLLSLKSTNADLFGAGLQPVRLSFKASPAKEGQPHRAQINAEGGMYAIRINEDGTGTARWKGLDCASTKNCESPPEDPFGGTSVPPTSSDAIQRLHCTFPIEPIKPTGFSAGN